MAEKLLPRLQQFTEFAAYNAAVAIDDEKAIAAVLQHIEEGDKAAFIADTPSYYACSENDELLAGWCNSRGIPMSLWNLTLAFRALSEDGHLKAAPAPAAPEVDNSRGVVQVRTDALLVYQTPSAESAALEKLRDDTNLSDHQRKARDRKLALLAGEQRRSLVSANLYRD
jgi:hypothetical protein